MASSQSKHDREMREIMAARQTNHQFTPARGTTRLITTSTACSCGECYRLRVSQRQCGTLRERSL